MYVFGCKLSLFRLCDIDFGITPVDDITIGITCAAFCFHIARISLLLLLLLTANEFIPGGSVLQCKTIQYNKIQYNTTKYNTIQCNTIAHITQNKIQHARQYSIRKITQKKRRRRTYILHYKDAETSRT